MGNCASDEATQASKAIDQQNRKDFKKSARVAKLLLLGTGEVLQPLELLIYRAETPFEIHLTRVSLL